MDMKIYTRDNMADLLRQHAINPTHQRLEIAYAFVNTKHSETSKATVYNTLNLFVEKKLIREVIVDPSKVFYDPNTHEHHHFYDVVSGHLTDIDAADFKISGLPVLPPGVITEGIDIIVRIRSQAVAA
ncbi:MAG: Fur family transcriptional regulator [Sulfuricella sp.]